ncbi:histidine kinase [Bacillus haynesii]|uniref:sensor histidine kinase n=1 Tax=Bacillus haynesii TaxID=1925021 RepID=UPI0022813277|nr:histidine kinase [Bacillus haynesii]MCY8666583.1 histidine kinase [Bacillus haynesii]
MELRIMTGKLILLGFIIYQCVSSEIDNLPWLVFSLLVYACINLGIAILPEGKIKKLFIIISVIISIFSYAEVHPLFILFLPFNLYEGAANFGLPKWAVLAASIVPVLFINESILAVYALATAFQFLLYWAASYDATRIEKLEHHIDQTRRDLQKLTNMLRENKEFIRQSEYTYKLEERNRLSQEIHDKIGHSITGALIQLEAAKRILDIDKEKASELLQNAINISKDGIENIRLTLKSVKPPSEQMGIHRLKLFIDECSAQYHMNISFLHKGDLDVISQIQWKIIFENITEALTNSVKYADATHVSIYIHVLNTLIKAEVKDNGKGRQKIKKGMGIIGMEERAASVNGKVIVDGSNGFSVTTLLPKHE